VATQGQTINTTPRMTGLLGSALSPGDQIKVYDGATELGVATVTGTTWTYTPATALALGAHTFKAKWIPVNGTTVTVSNDFVLTIQTSKLPHTGVSASQCYQSSADALLSCADSSATSLNSEQDGMRTTKNPISFSRLLKPDGQPYDLTECVQDNVTGLIWEGKTTSGARAGSLTYTNLDDTTKAQIRGVNTSRAPTQTEIDASTNTIGYVNAVNHLNNGLGLCAYTDWRLPTVEELQSIVDFGVVAGDPTPTLPTVQSSWFPNTALKTYWSSSPTDSEDAAWALYFGYGTSDTNPRSNTDDFAVRLVRGSPKQPATRFTANAAGDEVTDALTGLIWKRCSAGMRWDAATSDCTGFASTYTHEEALAYAQTQTGGWRLPNVRELGTLIDRSKTFNVFFSIFPSTMTNDPYWASTPNVSNSSKAWNVEFQIGQTVNFYQDGDDRTGSIYVRLVRDPAP
jgi:hypothetical protein